MSNLKLIDFGLARDLNNSQQSPKSLIVGTPLYIAPEVYKTKGQDKSYTPACDMWALGILMYNLFSGDFPFEGVDLKDQVINDDFSFDEHQLFKHVSDQAKNFITHLLKKEPEDRMTA